MAQLYSEKGFNVLAIDADSDTNLCNAFGISAEKSPEALIHMKDLIAERTGTSKEAAGAYFKLNPKVSDLPEKYWIDANGLKLLVLGSIDKAGAGCACSEGSFLKALLNYTILQRQEMVIVDMAAGVEFMGRASVKGIDVLIVVVEPGSRSIETAVNIAQMGRELGIQHIAAIINKVTEPKQIDTIKSQLQGITIIASIDYTPQVQHADLYRESVYQSSQQIVAKLGEARDALNNLIDGGVNPSIGDK